MNELCANGCNRPLLRLGSRFCERCLVGDVPLPCPALMPTDYLEACALELAARGTVKRGEQPAALTAELADRLWAQVSHQESTSSTDLLTSEVQP